MRGAMPDAGAKSDGDARDSSALRSATLGASYNAVLQLAFRLVTFGMNMVVLRFISPAMLGVVNVRLMLLNSSCLFPREAFRMSCLRVGQAPRATWLPVLNLTWISVPIGAAAGSLLCLVWTHVLTSHNQPADEGMADYGLAVWLYGLAAVLELASEPAYIYSQANLMVSLRVVAEGAGLLVKCVAGVACVVLLEPTLVKFAAAQLLYALTVFAVYFAALSMAAARGDIDLRPRDLLPQAIGGKAWYLATPPKLQSLAVSWFAQSIFKQLLTEGERYLMSVTSIVSFSDQGVYDVVNNLGSLVARFLFRPIEESFFVFFSGLLSSAKDKRDNEILAGRMFRTLATFVLLIALLICVFGQAYAGLALFIYGGSRLSAGPGPLLLRAYSVYVPFLAVNGITECFASAAMTTAEVNQHNRWMVGFSIAFLVAALVLIPAFGSLGFILANIVNMFSRIVKSSITIRRFFTTRSVAYSASHQPSYHILPSPPVLVALVVALAVTMQSERYSEWSLSLSRAAIHLAIGAVSFAAVLALVYFQERLLLSQMYDAWRGRTGAIIRP